MVVAIVLLATWALSIGAIVQPNHVTMGLVALNWMLIIDALVTLVAGTFIWMYTLQERANFHEVFSKQTPAIRIAIQDKVRRLAVQLVMCARSLTGLHAAAVAMLRLLQLV